MSIISFGQDTSDDWMCSARAFRILLFDVLSQLPVTDKFSYRINKSIALYILPFHTYIEQDRDAAQTLFFALKSVVNAVLEGKELDGMTWRSQMPAERYEGYQSHLATLKELMDRFAYQFLDEPEDRPTEDI